MARSRNKDVEQVFDLLESIITSTAVQAIAKSAQDLSKDVTEMVFQGLQETLENLGDEILRGAAEEPTNTTINWPRYTKKYEAEKARLMGRGARKRKRGRIEARSMPSFAFLDGGSGRALKNLAKHPEVILGNLQAHVEVRVGKNTFLLTPMARKEGQAATYRYAKGSYKIGPDGTRISLGGRFAGKLSDLENIQAHVTVAAAKDGQSTAEHIGALITRRWIEDNISPAFAAFEMGTKPREGAGEQPARPLFILTLRNFTEVELKKKLKEHFKTV